MTKEGQDKAPRDTPRRKPGNRSSHAALWTPERPGTKRLNQNEDKGEEQDSAEDYEDCRGEVEVAATLGDIS